MNVKTVIRQQNIERLDMITIKLECELKLNNDLTDYEFVKLINSFDRLQELIKLINIKKEV